MHNTDSVFAYITPKFYQSFISFMSYLSKTLFDHGNNSREGENKINLLLFSFFGAKLNMGISVTTVFMVF